MTTSAEEIVTRYEARKNARQPEINIGMEIQRAYNGEYVLPTSELDMGGFADKAAIANLIQLGVDQEAMRIASTNATVLCPPEKPGTKSSEDRAATRRRAYGGWWEMNDWEIKQGRRSRHLITFASTPVMIRPDRKRGIPKWHVRNPLMTFPAPSGDMDDMEPSDCIFLQTQTLRWLKDHYPDQVGRLSQGTRPADGDKFDILEFVDDSEVVLVVLGKANTAIWTPITAPQPGGSRFVELERVSNRAGQCLAVTPGRICLGRPIGQFDGMLGIWVRQARLAALEEIAVTRGVFANEWFVDTSGGQGTIVEYADGRNGVVGWVKGGEIKEVNINPGYKTPEAIDRMERAMRVEARIPADYGGESASNVRTDRRGSSIMSATVDFTVAEAQKLLARSYQKELQRATAVAKAYFGSERRSFYVSWTGASGQVDYIPDRDFTTDHVIVRYPLPGTDVNGLAVSAGQRLGLGSMSRRTWMELDPLVDDPDLEEQRILDEQFQQMGMSALGQGVNGGTMGIDDLDRVDELVKTQGKTLFEAIRQAHREAQVRQSSSVEPAQPGSPEAQPGLAPAGTAGAEAGVQPPPASVSNLSDLMRRLHSSSTQPNATSVQVA